MRAFGKVSESAVALEVIASLAQDALANDNLPPGPLGCALPVAVVKNGGVLKKLKCPIDLVLFINRFPSPERF